MAVEAVKDVASTVVTAVPTGAPVPLVQLDPNVAAVVQSVGLVAATVEGIAAKVGSGDGGGTRAIALSALLLGLVSVAVSIAHMVMGDRAMDERLDRIELVLTHMARKLDPDMADFIKK